MKKNNARRSGEAKAQIEEVKAAREETSGRVRTNNALLNLYLFCLSSILRSRL